MYNSISLTFDAWLCPKYNSSGWTVANMTQAGPSSRLFLFFTFSQIYLPVLSISYNNHLHYSIHQPIITTKLIIYIRYSSVTIKAHLWGHYLPSIFLCSKIFVSTARNLPKTRKVPDSFDKFFLHFIFHVLTEIWLAIRWWRDAGIELGSILS